MIRFVCAVFDSASQSYGNPVFSPAPGQVMREFSDQVNRSAQDNTLFHHPEDFSLWLLGMFDDESGAFDVSEGGKRCLARGQDVKNRAA